jgi:hypothetical protein
MRFAVATRRFRKVVSLLRFRLDSDCNRALQAGFSDKPSAVVLGLSIHMLSVPELLAPLHATEFNIQQFHVLPTQCIYVFCVDLRTNSDYFSIQR